MERFRPTFLLAAALLGAAALGAESASGPTEVPGSDPEFPKLKWSDGKVSVNDRCPVRVRKLNPKIDPLWVNGRPIGFC